MDIHLIAIKAFQLLCCLSLLVVLHEGGHYAFSKLFGVKVEKFFMFFDYKFHLFSTRDKWFTKLFPHFKDNETEYGIGWIPLGGYVKIAGMVDESMDTEQMKQPAQPDEFRSQAVWKRFCIMVGGVLMNLITAFVIYAAIMFTWGEERLPMQNIKQGLAFNAEAQKLGFRNGDIPIKVDGDEIEGYTGSLIRDFSNAETVTVLRQGKEVLIRMPEKGLNMLEMAEMKPAFYSIITESILDSITPDGAAAKAGMKNGCRLVAIDGTEIAYWHQYDSIMNGRKDHNLQVVFAQKGSTVTDTVTLVLNEKMEMGAFRHSPITEEQIETVNYTFLSSIPAGSKYGWGVLTGYVNDLKYVFTAKGAKSVGSFITIGSIFPDAWNWYGFWKITALISIILAVMNILPIPGLDGGHVVLLFYEGITGREPSEKVMEWIERIGIFILLALMLLAFGNDIVRWILPHFMG